ncbi:MAG: hypothetical protein COY40_02280 [Alphaproteobacteria bacterium CG_4_10_14_0_8_um_filter_53_9]|nr:MAG: hypothetical protein COY40_02280 [Alphaproteobacteria bacterium CG_4_10_14_0_8_um_filter_53_9]
MLTAFRNFGASKTSKALLLVLVLCFGAWGIGDYLVNSVGNDAVTVNGEGLSAAEVQRLYEARTSQITTLLGQTPTPQMLAELNVPATVLQEATGRAVMRQSAAEALLMPADSAVKDEIMASPEFGGTSGFDVTRYQDALARAGLTMAAFEKSVSADMSVRLLGEIAQTVRPAPAVAASLAALEDATVMLDVVTLQASDIKDLPPLADEDYQTFLNDNAAAFERPEVRDLEILMLTPADVAATLTLNDDDVKAAFEAAKDTTYADKTFEEVRADLEREMKTAEADKAIFDVQNEIDDRVAAGDDLAKVATDLGFSTTVLRKTPRQYVAGVDAAVMNAGFETEAGDVSFPVDMAGGGVAYVAVREVVPAYVPLLADIKEQVKTMAQAAQQQKALDDQSLALLSRVKSGELSFNDAGAVTTLSLADKQNIPNWLEPAMTTLSGLPVQSVLPNVLSEGKTRYLVRVASRTLASPDAEALDVAAGALRRRLQQDYETLLIAERVRDADIKLNDVRLRQIFGAVPEVR